MAVVTTLPPSSHNALPADLGGVRHSQLTNGTVSEAWRDDASARSSSSRQVARLHTLSLPYIPGANAGTTPDHLGTAEDVQTRLPSICVDYLSHDWNEEDIASSWKAMTKHKADLANGVRLENASWRTWAKQRNKLRTISPETLNWLKDSDVTWLYGPLHTAVDPVPPARAATMEDRLNLDPQTQARHAANPLIKVTSDVRAKAPELPGRSSQQPTKPILKYRSLSDILSVPTHRNLADYHYEDPDEAADGRSDATATPRPGITHTHSDTTVPRPATARRSPTLAAGDAADRTDSPHVQPPGPPTPSDNSASTSADELEPVRKHISFNHFVEQCIAVDSDDDSRFYESGSSGTSEEDDEDDEDDALSFRSSPRGGAFPLAKTQPLHLEREREPHTIAKLAPTVLKSSELFYPSPSPAVVYNGQVMGGGVADASSPTAAAGPQQWEHALPPAQAAAGTQAARWEDEEELSAPTYDYFDGNADLGVGDEYTNGAASTSRGKGVSRTPSDQSPASSAGPSSPNLAAPDQSSRAYGRSILKSRQPGPYNADAPSVADGTPVGSSTQQSPPYASYADAAKAPAQPAPVQRGRSISRGSSSSSLDRSASQDSRRSSPQVISGAEPERGRSFRRNNSSASSLNNLGTSPSSNASDATLPSRIKRDPEEEQEESSSTLAAGELGPSSSSSSSASLKAHGEDVASHPPAPASNEPPDRGPPDLSAHDYAQDDGPDFDRDPTFLFDSPHMPSSPTSGALGLPRNNSFSTALQSVRWSDDEPSAARRALLRAQSRDSAVSGGRRTSTASDLVDDYGLNFASFSDDEETGGIVGRAVEIVGTARDLVGALWTVAFRRG